MFEKITDSPWLVPLLLTLLALLLILGAYAIGRAFAGRVDHVVHAEVGSVAEVTVAI